MKTKCTDFDNVTFSFDGNQCLLCIGNKVLIPEIGKFTALFYQFRISKSALLDSLLFISKAVIKESVGADMDVKLLIMLIAGYVSLFKESFFHLSIIRFFKNMLGHRIRQHELTFN